MAGTSRARAETPEIEIVSAPKKPVEKRKASPSTSQAAKPSKAAKTTNAQPKQQNCQWSASEDASLISTLEEKQLARSVPINVIANSVWPEVAKKLNAYNKDHSKDKDAAACKARFTELKRLYRAFKRLKNMSGGGWDERNKRVIFDPSWWDDWAEAGGKKADDILAFRYKGFPLFDDMFHLVEKDRTY